jgi:hypothetical protein
MAGMAQRSRLAPFYSSALNAETNDLGVGRGGPGDGTDVASMCALLGRAVLACSN